LPWRRHGASLLSNALWVADERNGPDVCADGRRSFGALAEAVFSLAKLTESEPTFVSLSRKRDTSFSASCS
jgi:hypothetical protein